LIKVNNNNFSFLYALRRQIGEAGSCFLIRFSLRLVIVAIGSFPLSPGAWWFWVLH
jgi:hypothetical protein